MKASTISVYCERVSEESHTKGDSSDLRPQNDEKFYSELQTHESSTMRLRLGGRNDGGSCENATVFPPQQGRVRVGAEPNQLPYRISNLVELGKKFCLPQLEKAGGFTLAEVLITLGIIGIVAAMTLPTVISNYKKTEIETKLKRFYSMANQAIKMAEIEHGPAYTWNYFATAECQADEYSESCLRGFWDKYLEKYFKYTKTEYVTFGTSSLNQHGLLVYLNDGSVLRIQCSGLDYIYFINSAKAHKTSGTVHGKDWFLFGFYPYSKNYPMFYKKGIEPYVQSQCRTVENWQECVRDLGYNYSKIIQLNEWKIPDDYPVKL